MRSDKEAILSDRATLRSTGPKALAVVASIPLRTSAGYRFVFPEGAGPREHTHAHGQIVFAPTNFLTVVAEGRMWLASPVHVVWIPPDVPHEVRATRERDMRNLYLAPGLAGHLPATTAYVEVSPVLRELLLCLVDETPPMPPTAAPWRRRLLAAAVAEFRRLNEMSNIRPIATLSVGEPHLRSIAEALAADPADTRGLEDWAQGLGMSARTLSRIVRRATGLNWREWRLGLRMTEAVRRLTSGTPVKIVAHDLGYAGAKPFVAAFTQAYGATPSQIAKKRPSPMRRERN
jgi:AraC-like DNA-binding protein/quercetin dioxygenase-like cupin family protein